MEFTNYLKIFCSSYFILYLLIAFVWPTLRTFRKTGINPVTFAQSDNAHDFIGKWFKILTALLLASIIFSWVGNKTYACLVPVAYLQNAIIQVTGLVLALVSLVWISVAQQQMGSAWRIGLDHKNKTPLVQHGLFSVSRNPVFFGMITSLLGFFFLMPNALTLLILICGYLLIQIQIRLEEEFLLNKHGELYKQYLNTVRRMI